jgi:hypothetical protein
MTKNNAAPAIHVVVLQGLRWKYEENFSPQIRIEDGHQRNIGW